MNNTGMKPDLAPAPAPAPTPRRPSRLRAGLTWVARLFIAGAVLGTVAPLVNTLHPLLDLAGQFLVQASVVTILGLGLAVLYRDRWSGIVLACCFAAQIVQLQPHMADRQPGAQAMPTPGAALPTARTVKIIHFNLFVRNDDAKSVLDFLAREDADIVSLVEVSPAWRVALLPLRARYPYYRDCPQRRCDVAIFSKLPIRGATLGFDQPDGFPMAEAAFDLADGPLTLFGAHLARPFYGPLGTQFGQAQRLATRIAAVPGRKILVGDLNAVPWSAVLGELERRGGLVRLGGLEGTWPSLLPWPMQITIDHALTDPSLASAPVRIGPNLGSDHLPVIVELRVATPAR